MRCAACPVKSFLPANLREFAYEDAPLPIEEGQTISQPYIVAFMTEALALRGGEAVLEIGTGSGYAAAVLSTIAANVYTVERHGPLAEKAAATLADLGYDNVRVLHADGTRGWPEHAPFDAIVVAAGGPTVPESLKSQLKIGGRLVMPVGTDQRAQELVRVTRTGQSEYRCEDLADVRFVPLLGEEGWAPEEAKPTRVRPSAVRGAAGEEMLLKSIVGAAEPFELDRYLRSQPAARTDWRRARRVAWRGNPWHLRILPDARAHFARAYCQEGVSLNRHRGRLAGCGAHRSLRPALRIFSI